MRFVYVDALIDKWRTDLDITENDKADVFVGYSYITSTINDVPSIDLILCENCRYYHFAQHSDGKGYCRCTGYQTNIDDFCSKGERSEDNATC